MYWKCTLIFVICHFYLQWTRLKTKIRSKLRQRNLIKRFKYRLLTTGPWGRSKGQVQWLRSLLVFISEFWQCSHSNKWYFMYVWCVRLSQLQWSPAGKTVSFKLNKKKLSLVLWIWCFNQKDANFFFFCQRLLKRTRMIYVTGFYFFYLPPQHLTGMVTVKEESDTLIHFIAKRLIKIWNPWWKRIWSRLPVSLAQSRDT